MSKVGFLYSSEFQKHFSEYSHPERPERLLGIVELIQEREMDGNLEGFDFGPVSDDQLLLAHEPEQIARVNASSKSKSIHLDQGDTYANNNSFLIAKLAAGACIAAGDRVMAGEIDRAFCCIRPPGHHANQTHSMGFCLFNNVAILARHLQNRHELNRIAIVDWDVHHGNGTQDIFYEDPSVFYFSVHQHPHYPGTGLADETGAGPGAGYTLNVPVAAKSGDAEFLSAIDDDCIPALSDFNPDIVLISAGFDAHENDPLADCLVSSSGFGALTRSLAEFAKENCSGRMISVLEGGYNIEALSESVGHHLREMAD